MNPTGLPGQIPGTGDLHRDPYLFNPEDYSWPTPAPLRSCGAPVRCVRGCGCGVELLPEHCDKKSCSHLYCSRINRERRARDVEDRFEASRRGRDVIYAVLTVPPHLRGKFGDRTIIPPKPSRAKAKAKKKPRTAGEVAWKKAQERLVRYLKAEEDFDYGVERTDPCGDDGEKWHPHINLLWVRKSGSGYINPDALERLKDRWRWIIGASPDEPISVYVHFATDRAHPGHERDSLNYDPVALRKHWYSYMGRVWPRWEEEFPYHLKIKWLGKPAKTPERTPDPCCPKCEREVVVMNFGSLEEAERLAGLGYERLREEYEDRKAHFRRQRPAKFTKFTVRVGPGGSEWIPERRDR